MPIAAAWNGREGAVRALLEAGTDVNKAVDKGGTALYITAQEGHETIVRELIEAGADINKAVSYKYLTLPTKA